jgi:hypothetical protein
MVFVQGCANGVLTQNINRSSNITPIENNLIGTWEYISFTQGANGKSQSMNGLFIRFFADETCAIWPMPFSLDKKRFSYKVENGRLSFPDENTRDGDQANVTVTTTVNGHAPGEPLPFHLAKDNLLVQDGEYETQLRRIRPDLEPGQLP